MQAVILAAGLGKRMKYMTSDNTKCMVEVNGRKLIDRSLEILTRENIKRIVIVVGYCGDKVIDHLGDSYNGVPIVYVENPVYDKTNNIYSLALASELLEEDDTLLLESDLIYDAGIIRKLLLHPDSNVAVVDKYSARMDGTVVKISEEHDILAFIPKKYFDYREADSYYKTVNIYKFSKEFLQESYIPFLNAYSRALGLNQYYEQVLRVILTLEQNNLKAMPLEGEKWYEIDDLQDLSNAELLFANNEEEKLSLYQKRYGGYWKFPEITDFCYLVNPYFPPQRFIEECKHSFRELLENYPSGQSFQNLLAANYFDVTPEYILVGNGAAELICALMKVAPGKVGLPYPTFEEYPARISPDKLVRINTSSDDGGFSYTIDLLRQYLNEINSLVLINPDNPSGNFISKADLLLLAKECRDRNILFVVDESFVDFSSGQTENSIIHQDILDEYPNLVVIKSISKSYGVPGLRLGVIASRNCQLLESVRKNLSIWNINSFAEFFLQIMPKYKEAYEDACLKIANERDRFIGELEKIPFLKVFPSQANYVFCMVAPEIPSSFLTSKLLKDHGILIKDCSNKEGIPEGRYVRIAVKAKEENNVLISILKSRDF